MCLTTLAKRLYVEILSYLLNMSYRVLDQLCSLFHVVVAMLSIGSLIAGEWGVTSTPS